MNALLRRRELMLQTPKEKAPLYQIYQGTHVARQSARAITISGNHVDDLYTGGAQDDFRHIRLSGTQDTYNEPIASDWFTLRAGDIITLRRKNASFRNDYSGASTTCQQILEDISGATVISLSMSAGSAKTITPDDTETSVLLSSDTAISCFRFYTNRTSYAVYDLELEVNGERYI